LSNIRATTISDETGNGPIALTKQEAPKLVVRYTTVTTTASVGSPLNVSSLTDNGTGDTSISITSAFNNALYAIFATGTINYSSSGTGAVGPYDIGSWGGSSYQTASVTRIAQRYSSPSSAQNLDIGITSVALIGDLA